jgi:hypothetical protein
MGVLNGLAKIAKQKEEKTTLSWDLRVSPHYGSITFSKTAKEKLTEVGFYLIDRKDEESFGGEFTGYTAGTVIVCVNDNSGSFEKIGMVSRKVENGIKDSVIIEILSTNYNEQKTSEGIEYQKDENGLCFDEKRYNTVRRVNNFLLGFRHEIMFTVDVDGEKVSLVGYPLEFVKDLGFPADRFQTEPKGRKITERELIETT